MNESEKEFLRTKNMQVYQNELNDNLKLSFKVDQINNWAYLNATMFSGVSKNYAVSIIFLFYQIMIK